MEEGVHTALNFIINTLLAFAEILLQGRSGLVPNSRSLHHVIGYTSFLMYGTLLVVSAAGSVQQKTGSVVEVSEAIHEENGNIEHDGLRVSLEGDPGRPCHMISAKARRALMIKLSVEWGMTIPSSLNATRG